MTLRQEFLAADSLTGNTSSDKEVVSVHEVIYQYHGALIKFLQRRLRVNEDAQDVAQETYIRMMKYEGANDIRSASSMLFRIAANVACDLERSSRCRQAKHHIPIDDAELVADQPSIERTLTAEKQFSRVSGAIDELPPKCKRVFLLSRVRGMTYPEIAKHCGISVKMVEKHISRALALCLKSMQELEVGDGDD